MPITEGTPLLIAAGRVMTAHNCTGQDAVTLFERIAEILIASKATHKHGGIKNVLDDLITLPDVPVDVLEVVLSYGLEYSHYRGTLAKRFERAATSLRNSGDLARPFRSCVRDFLKAEQATAAQYAPPPPPPISGPDDEDDDLD